MLNMLSTGTGLLVDGWVEAFARVGGERAHTQWNSASDFHLVLIDGAVTMRE
jgi:hypothetical protein